MIGTPLIQFSNDERIVKDSAYWEQRHWNPEVKMRWNSEIEVHPANKEKGRLTGTRIFPNGQSEQFRVNP